MEVKRFHLQKALCRQEIGLEADRLYRRCPKSVRIPRGRLVCPVCLPPAGPVRVGVEQFVLRSVSLPT